MDKPLELLVSNQLEEAPVSPMKNVMLSFPIQALVVSDNQECIDIIGESLKCFSNLDWQSITNSAQAKDVDKDAINLILLVLPPDEAKARSVLAFAATFEADIILLGRDTSQNILRLAFQFDVNDFIPLDEKLNQELHTSLEKTAARLIDKAKLAPVLAVINGKAGSGASFIAASLAVLASDRKDCNVALLDTDLLHGMLAHILGLEPHYFISDALRAIDNLDEVALKSAMTSRKQLNLLAAMPFASINIQNEIKLENINDLLWKCRRYYDQIIIDLSRGPDYWNAEVLNHADIIIVTQQNVMNIRQTKAMVNQLTVNMGIKKDKIHLLVNRYANSDISLNDIKDAIGISSIFTVANDYKLASECVDLGQPISKVAKKQKMYQDFKKLTERFIPLEGVDEEDKAGFWKRILGK